MSRGYSGQCDRRDQGRKIAVWELYGITDKVESPYDNVPCELGMHVHRSPNAGTAGEMGSSVIERCPSPHC